MIFMRSISQDANLPASNQGVVLSLFDLTGIAIEPWVEAGWEGWIVDVQHEHGVHVDGRGIFCVGADIRHGWLPPRKIIERLGFVFAFPPVNTLRSVGHAGSEARGYASCHGHLICLQPPPKFVTGRVLPI
jgi:hypothetical protein